MGSVVSSAVIEMDEHTFVLGHLHERVEEPFVGPQNRGAARRRVRSPTTMRFRLNRGSSAGNRAWVGDPLVNKRLLRRASRDRGGELARM